MICWEMLIKLTRDPKSPLGQNPCARLVAAVDYHYHPERLNYPLKRAGERGDGNWQRISWEQAMDEIAQKLDSIRARFGPEAVVALGGGNPHPGDPAPANSHIARLNFTVAGINYAGISQNQVSRLISFSYGNQAI